MYSLKQYYAKDIDPATAQDWLKTRNQYLGQRNFRTRHCNELAAKMADKRFMRGFIVFGVLPTGELMLANGQHQLTAVVRSGKTINANVEEYNCTNPGDIYALYTQIDQGKSRTQADVLKASRGNMENSLRMMPTSFMGLCGAAVLMSARTPEPLFLSREVGAHARAAAAKDNADLVRFMGRYSHMAAARRIPVLMAMAATWRVDPERAGIFWGSVADGTCCGPASDPRAMLRAVLLLPRKKGSSSASGVHELYSTCINHWNALAAGMAVEDYDPTAATPSAQRPTAPLPVLARVTNMPRPVPTPSQTFTAPAAPLATSVLRAAQPNA